MFTEDARVTIVFGGTGGIGAAVTKHFSNLGGRVAIADIDAEAGEALATELGGVDRAVFLHCDVRSEEEVSAAFDAAVARFGAVHNVINAAGVVAHNHTLPLDEVTIEEYDDTQSINLRGSFLVVKHAARTMKRLRIDTGAVVNLGSVCGLRGSAITDASYQITKFGVIGLTQMAAAKLCGDKIRVNCISPTSVETPMIAAAMASRPPEVEAQQAAVAAMLAPLRQQLVKPERVAALAAFLCSDAAIDLTGVNVPIDQGYGAGANANYNAMLQSKASQQ